MEKQETVKSVTLIEPRNIGLLHKVYLIFLKNTKKYLASTKTRAEVRGGGRKPWKQKGTGKARAGSNRSPIWVGGGVTFGPKFHIAHKKINNKERIKAIKILFELKRANTFKFNEQCVSKDLIITKHSIKTFLKKHNLLEKRIVFILDANNKQWPSAKFSNMCVTMPATNLNFLELLKAEYIIISECVEQNKNNLYGTTIKNLQSLTIFV